jgi:hypothetical protein
MKYLANPFETEFAKSLTINCRKLMSLSCKKEIEDLFITVMVLSPVLTIRLFLVAISQGKSSGKRDSSVI